MRRTSSFRLSRRTRFLLDELASRLGISRTAVIERAVARFAEEILDAVSPLARLAGALDPDEADAMLEAVRTFRKSKPTPPGM